MITLIIVKNNDNTKKKLKVKNNVMKQVTS